MEFKAGYLNGGKGESKAELKKKVENDTIANFRLLLNDEFSLVGCCVAPCWHLSK